MAQAEKNVRGADLGRNRQAKVRDTDLGMNRQTT